MSTAFDQVVNDLLYCKAPISIVRHPPVLTANQLSVLRLIADGQDTKRAARTLGVSPWTVRDYRRALMRRLEARTMEQAVSNAYRRGVLTCE